jgi:hypothetical protein
LNGTASCFGNARSRLRSKRSASDGRSSSFAPPSTGSTTSSEILERVPDPSDRRKVSYRLTDKGRDLLPVLLSLRQWGERWVSGKPSNPVLVDCYTRQPIAPMAVRAADGRVLTLNELEWIDRSDVPRP